MSIDLDRANQFASKRRAKREHGRLRIEKALIKSKKKRAELAAREWRKQKREREERRLIELLQAGVSGGWIR